MHILQDGAPCRVEVVVCTSVVGPTQALGVAPV